MPGFSRLAIKHSSRWRVKIMGSLLDYSQETGQRDPQPTCCSCYAAQLPSTREFVYFYITISHLDKKENNTPISFGLCTKKNYHQYWLALGDPQLNSNIADCEIPADVASQRLLLICDMSLCLNLPTKTVKLIPSRWVQYGDTPSWHAELCLFLLFSCWLLSVRHCKSLWWWNLSTFVSWSRRFRTIYFQGLGEWVKFFTFFGCPFRCSGSWTQQALAMASGLGVNWLYWSSQFLLGHACL